MDRTTVDRQGESIISPHNVVCGYNKKIKLLLQQVLSKTKLIGLKIIEKKHVTFKMLFIPNSLYLHMRRTCLFLFSSLLYPLHPLCTMDGFGMQMLL